MDDPNISMEEYVRLEEEKSRKRGKVFNWETARYGKIWYDEDVHDLRSIETEFPAIVFNDNLTSNETLSSEPMVSSLNDNEIDFRILFDESDDEDYTVVFDKNSFSYKIMSTNDLKTDSENDNEKVNVPLFPSPEPTVSCIDDLDFFKDFENEFPAIVYNDALTSKSDFSTKPTLCPQHIDEFDMKDETSLSEYDEVEQNILYFNDLFHFNIIYLDNLKSDKGDDDNEIDMIQSSGGNEDTHGLNKLLERSHDKICKVFTIRSFVMKLNVNIVAWNHLVNRMLFNLIKNLYVPFGILFDPKRYYKDGDCARMLQRPRYGCSTTRSEAPVPEVFDFDGLPDLIAEGLSTRMQMEHMDAQGFGEAVLDLDTPGALQFYARRIPDKGDLRDYWIRISSAGDFLGTTPSYTFIRDPMLRLCHRLIACTIIGRSQAPKKVTVTSLFYLRGMDVGSVNVPYLLARYLRLFASGGKQGALISGGQYICAEFGDTWAWVPAGPTRQEGDAGGVVKEAPVAPGGGDKDEEMPQAVPPPPRTHDERIALLEEEVHGIREVLQGQIEVLDIMASDFSRFTTWTVTSLTRLMNRTGVPYTGYLESPVEYQRYTRQTTGKASTSAAPQQPDYATQVGCEQCKGPHYTKDCPLKEEEKTLQEAYYTQFGAPFQRGGYRATALGFYQRNNANPSYQEQSQSMEETLSKFMSEYVKRHEENSNLIKEI
ncbi:hypothetical protein Tco_0552815 [Tanacetum coccineum]